MSGFPSTALPQSSAQLRPVRPLSLANPLTPAAVTTNPVTPANLAETPPTIIGPTAHLAGHMVSGDSHMISHGASGDRQKEQIFSPTSAEEDQMRHIEKVLITNFDF